MFRWIRRLLLICSGVNREILERPECAIDYKRSTVIGAFVLTNAVVASLGAAYLIYEVFRSWPITLFSGVLWGVTIGALDRLSVAPLPKRAMAPNLSFAQRVRFRSRDLGTAVPRLVLAVFVGIIVAAPLRLRLFEPLIAAELNSRHFAARRQAESATAHNVAAITELEQQNRELKERLASRREEARLRFLALLDEPSVALLPERRREYLLSRNLLAQEETTAAQTVAANNKRLMALRKAIQDAETDLMRRAPLADKAGIVNRMAVLDELSSRPAGDRIRSTSVALSVLFVIMQLMPILTKLLAPAGPYEYFWEALEVMSAQKRFDKGLARQAKQSGQDGQLDVGSDTRVTVQRRLMVFLCHASDDKPRVRALARRLRGDGVEVWLDEERLLPGQDWNIEIAAAVHASDVVVVCLSRTSVNKTGYVQRELRIAVEAAGEHPERAIFLIPAKLDECEIPPSLQKLHFVRMFEESGYDHLMRSLKVRADEKGLVMGHPS